jgi:hypothetical protein
LANLISLGLCLLLAVLASFQSSIVRAILFAWAAALALGLFFLTSGFELLALVQWVGATLIALGSIYYALLSGGDAQGLISKKTILGAGTAIAWVLAAAWLVKEWKQPVNPPTSVALVEIGKFLGREHFVAAILLGLFFLLSVTAVGDLARRGKEDS